MKTESLPIKNFQEVKTYSLAWFRIHESLACSQVYLIDKKARKVWMYQMNRAAKDETARSQRRYESNLKKGFMQQLIGGELFKLMDNQDDTPHFLKVIAHSESAKEITAESLLKCRRQSARVHMHSVPQESLNPPRIRYSRVIRLSVKTERFQPKTLKTSTAVT